VGRKFVVLAVEITYYKFLCGYYTLKSKSSSLWQLLILVLVGRV